MAHLWITNDAGEWIIEPLDAGLVALSGLAVDRAADESGRIPDAKSVLIVRALGPTTESWVLMAGAGADARVNGVPAVEGIRVLSDRDELVVNGQRRYFSTEVLARVTAGPARETPPLCPRCQQAIQTGSEAVRCPHCGVWHHESAALPCWTYADTCAVCPQPTDLSAGYRWMPEPEER